MFTGLIQSLGKVTHLKRKGEGARIGIEFDTLEEALRIDESIAVSGVCLTVTTASGRYFEVDAVEETLKKTALGKVPLGGRVNLERALRADGRFGGHIVQGHVDTTGQLLSVKTLDNSWEMRVSIDASFSPLIVPIGSIAVDGVSLTVAECGESWFKVAIIPYTYTHTTLSLRQAGDAVNLEFDILGKYIAKQLQWLRRSPEGQAPLTETDLRRLGYSDKGY